MAISLDGANGITTPSITSANAISLSSGSASAPALAPSDDTNTGIFFPAADTIAFAEGGAEAMRLDANGNVGIGTSSPASKLHVLTGTNTGVTFQNAGGAGIQMFTDSTPSNADFILNYYGGSPNQNGTAYIIRQNGTERARITSGGFVKQSNNGNYVNIAGATNEFNNSTDFETVSAVNWNNSLSRRALITGCTRSASSSYYCIESWSGDNSAQPFSDREFGLRGDGNGYADGTWNNNGADYAEFFESANGQALTLGATVVLDGNKVREATDQDPATSIIGVVRPKEPSKASMVVGNTAWNKWANKYLTDDFDRYIMEDHDVVEWTDEDGKEHSYESQSIPAGITVPDNATRKTHDDKGNKFQHYKLNPEWDPDSEYVNRENRPEWNIIGLLGQVKILKGQPVGDRWIKMRDVSETVEEWFIR